MGGLIGFCFLGDRTHEDFSLETGAGLILKDRFDVLAGATMRGLVLDEAVKVGF